MVGSQKPICKHCNSNNLIRWGGPGTTQTWKCKTCNRHSNIGKKIPKIPIQLEYNYSLGYIIGVIKGDGSMGKYKEHRYLDEKGHNVAKNISTRKILRTRYQFQLCVKDKDFTEEYLKHINILMGKTPKIYIVNRKPVTEIAGNKLKKPYAPTFYKFNVTSEEWYHKLKPLVDKLEWLKTTNKEVKKGFLRGIFDSEGGAYEEKYRVRIHLTNKNFDIIQITQKLLGDFDINSRICNFNDNLMRIYIDKNSEIIKYFDKIGFSIKRKQKKVEFYK